MRVFCVERWIVWLVTAFLAAAAWLFSGLRVRDLPWFAAGAVVLLVLAMGCGWVKGAGREGVRRAWWTRDAFFWGGLLFLAYLGLQAWNSGRALFFDVEHGRWAYSAPMHVGWPWAFNRQEALEMVYWFFPAWAIGLVLRAPCMTRQGLTRFAHGVVCSGGLLASFGIVQYLSGSRGVYWAVPLGCDFFASFTYSNHAAAYFVMIGALGSGLLLREALRSAGSVRKTHVVVLGVAVVLCLAGANLSLSRAGVILAWVLAVFIVGYGLIRGWRALRPVARLNMGMAMLAAVAILYFAVSGFGRAEIRREFSVRRPPLHQLMPALAGINLDLSVRPMLWRAGWEVFKAHPLYGVGGWGFRYLAAFHIPPDSQEALRRSRGWANVHNDPIQFLAEFGLAGMACMIVAAGALVAPLAGHAVRRGSVYTLTCAGLGLVVVFSLIDLPFRCPAILWTWVAILAALPRLRIIPSQSHMSQGL